MYAVRLTAVAALLLTTLPVPAQNKTVPDITLKTVKYAGLADAVAQNRGKVVVVDLWAFY